MKFQFFFFFFFFFIYATDFYLMRDRSGTQTFIYMKEKVQLQSQTKIKYFQQSHHIITFFFFGGKNHIITLITMECQKSIKKKKMVSMNCYNSNSTIPTLLYQRIRTWKTNLKNKRETNLNLTCFEVGDTKVKKPRDQGGGTHISNQ